MDDSVLKVLNMLLCATGDPFLSHLERQPETFTLHLQPGASQPGRVAAHLQDLRPAGGRGGTDIPAAHGHPGGNLYNTDPQLD